MIVFVLQCKQHQKESKCEPEEDRDDKFRGCPPGDEGNNGSYHGVSDDNVLGAYHDVLFLSWEKMSVESPRMKILLE